MTKPDPNFIWSIADLLRGPYRPKEYGTVILPFTVLARLDSVLAPTKAAVLDAAAKYENSPALVRQEMLRRASGQSVTRLPNFSRNTLKLITRSATITSPPATGLRERIRAAAVQGRNSG